MLPPTASTGLTITNPLVLYRSLLATKRIDPDPSQHRLAIHLQKLYHRLKDYEPEIEYSRRISQLSHALAQPTAATTTTTTTAAAADISPNQAYKKGIFAAISGSNSSTLALTRRLTDHESAMRMTSPRGLLLYGEVGTGKSMLVDLLADCLPTRKKRRWHFNTFMLEIFDRLEQFRKRQSLRRSGSGSGSELRNYGNGNGNGNDDDEHSMLWLAREMISTSPILFLDEFQLPDRAASKILSNLMTSFFHLGGVLVATSNRMPEELAKASGIELARPPSSSLGSRWNPFGPRAGGRSESMFAGQSDFAAFLEVLRARCEVWDMEGSKDWRRREMAEDRSMLGAREQIGAGQLSPHASPLYYFVSESFSKSESQKSAEKAFQVALSRSVLLNTDSHDLSDIPWEPTSLQIYGRSVLVAQTLDGIAKWSFSDLCGSALGPADYITFASTFHTVIITNVPILTGPLKNEARRFITLLDALYESRCKLLISAAAGPDGLFFPDTESTSSSSTSSSSSAPDAMTGATTTTTTKELVDDATLAETFSELYQDQTAPFRPNITAYTSSSSSSAYISSTSPSASRSSSFSDPSSSSLSSAINFRRTDLFTGEDERFAYKRARSRLWELCSRRWWARDGDWWRPVRKDVRRWETNKSTIDNSTMSTTMPKPRVAAAAAAEAFHMAVDEKAERSGQAPERDTIGMEEVPMEETRREEEAKAKEKKRSIRKRESAAQRVAESSPFRTSAEPPPRISWVHAWGMMQWGKKAGEWGKGVDGLRRGKGDGKGSV